MGGCPCPDPLGMLAPYYFFGGSLGSFVMFLPCRQALGHPCSAHMVSGVGHHVPATIVMGSMVSRGL